jgi:hypothetical protein
MALGRKRNPTNAKPAGFFVPSETTLVQVQAPGQSL